MPSLILASSSPRRRRLLADAGFEFAVDPPSDGAEPDTIEGAGPSELVAELARLKGIDVSRRSGEDTIILSADTVAECDGRVLGKPRDEGHAREMLTWLSGREHQVLTGFCLLRGGDEDSEAEVVSTTLVMSDLTNDWLEPYLASGGWRGKAGAFGFQDGLSFVRILNGSESNVVGLPMERVLLRLAELGCFPSGASGS